MGFLIGGAYVGPMRKALNDYRKKLQPSKGATFTQMMCGRKHNFGKIGHSMAPAYGMHFFIPETVVLRTG